MKKVRIATRKSKLAMWQSEFIKRQLELAYPKLEIELVGITTEGDRVLDRSLSEIGGKGLFIKELEAALLNNEADFAVHSLKDLPSTLTEGFVLTASGFREDARDALITREGSGLKDLASGASVGSSSLRRQSQLKALRPDLVMMPIRGNVDTRLNKLEAGEFDAIVLAAAGLKRLGMEGRVSDYLTIEQSLPCPGQAALGIECLSDALEVRELVSVLNDRQVEKCILTERTVSRSLGGDCSIPLAAYCTENQGKLYLRCFLSDATGTQVIRSEVRGLNSDEVGLAAANELFELGAEKILASLNDSN
ncbi:MAG: hydroxymethylbilane synthase [Pseudomonadales bacterium]|nr:hydroxymethylbilane synthase [Pseudomonadales bacterium]